MASRSLFNLVVLKEAVYLLLSAAASSHILLPLCRQELSRGTGKSDPLLGIRALWSPTRYGSHDAPFDLPPYLQVATFSRQSVPPSNVGRSTRMLRLSRIPSLPPLDKRCGLSIADGDAPSARFPKSRFSYWAPRADANPDAPQYPQRPFPQLHYVCPDRRDPGGDSFPQVEDCSPSRRPPAHRRSARGAPVSTPLRLCKSAVHCPVSH